MYDFLSTNTAGLNTIRPANMGVQSLGKLLDELDVEALWSAREVMIPLGTFAFILMRLFAGPYSTDEENLIVRMLTLATQRATLDQHYYGFTDHRHQRRSEEPFATTYRRKGNMLRDFTAFGYMLQITENMGRISHKHRMDLVLLYFILTIPEVRLHRRWNATATEDGLFAFRDRITGRPIESPTLMARPFSIEMNFSSVFGNVAANARLLDRSLLVALNNRHRNPSGMNAAQEVELLMESARLLDLSDNVSGAGNTFKPFPVEHEHAALRHMLEMTAIVSMMAEEYRVFVAGAPPSRPNGGTDSSKKRSFNNNGFDKRSTNGRPGTTAFRRPIFYAFKPTTQRNE